MKDIAQGILGIIIVALIVCGVSWVFIGNSLLLTKGFAPEFEQVRRETFEQSKAYNQGVSQDISMIQQEYIKATAEQKDALASIVIHRYADYDLGLLKADQRLFIEKLRGGQR